MANKILGYILIALGLLIILGTIYSSYNVFTGKSSMPEIFRVPLQTATPNSQSLDVQKQMEQAMEKQLSNLIPFDAVSKILNLMSWSVLAGIFIFGGAKIAELGIKTIAIKTI